MRPNFFSINDCSLLNEIIFLSAQPDDYFFTWQIELQIYNFNKLGICKANIHVLIGYDPKAGLRHYFVELIEKHKEKATFHPYPDNRLQKNYLPSLRPHIIKQHFAKHPWLNTMSIFYHDSDIIFRELPAFEKMMQDDNWFVSDTRSYLDSNYIIQASNESIFQKMCSIVGVNPKLIKENDNNCGGAQYLLKCTTVEFWGKVEYDCELIFKLLIENNLKSGNVVLKRGQRFYSDDGIQAWCADMWALFWNALYFGNKIKISSELDFCWAPDSIKEWNTKKILHYTGTTNKEDYSLFCKTNFFHYPPYFENRLKEISPQSASFPLGQLIEDYQYEQDKIDLTDVSFLIACRLDSEIKIENLLAITNYIHKYFATSIIILESDIQSRIPTNSLPACCITIFNYDANSTFNRTIMNNKLIKMAKTSIIVLYESDIIFPIGQTLEAVNIIRNHNADLVVPYDGNFIVSDNLFGILFKKILDPELFLFNQSKFSSPTKRSWKGCAIVLKSLYINAGMDNEYIRGSGQECLERVKRMKNLGYVTKRINGPAFSLTKDPNIDSYFSGYDVDLANKIEYLKISNMKMSELRNYVITWKWKH